jgi:hypothetical protein
MMHCLCFSMKSAHRSPISASRIPLDLDLINKACKFGPQGPNLQNWSMPHAWFSKLRKIGSVISMTAAYNIVGVVLIVYGLVHTGVAILKPEGNCYYKLLRARADVCCKEEIASKWIIVQGILLTIFGILFMAGVFPQKE